MSTFDDNNVASLEVESVEGVEQEQARMEIRAIKFKGGEEVVAGIWEDDLDWTMKKFVWLQQPMQVGPHGEMKPWSAIGNQYQYEISTDLIRSMYEITRLAETAYDDAAQEQHLSFLRADLADPDITDEEREQVEAEIREVTDYADPLDKPLAPPEKYGYLEVSRTVH